jgi:hypothetical protein
LRDVDAAPCLHQDGSRNLQSGERLSHRGSTDLEALGQVAFRRQPISRRELTCLDQGQDLVNYLGEQAHRLDRPKMDWWQSGLTTCPLHCCKVGQRWLFVKGA